MNFWKSAKGGVIMPWSTGALSLEIMCSAGISYYLVIIPPHIYATISVIKKLQYKFGEMSVGGSKAVWNFSENSSDLVAGPFP